MGKAPGRGRLKGKRILIGGGGQRVFDAATDPIGNGRAMSILFAREGAEVAVADINLASARETVSAIETEGGYAFAIEADVARREDIIRMLAEAQDRAGGIDGMVLNVGVFGQPGLANATLEEWDRTLAVNLRAPMLCCREGMARLSDSGSIVFISSIAALSAGSQLVSCDSSKAALGGLMRHVALEGFKRGIRANIVYPGLVDTPNGRIAGAGRP
jgi:NAD(P)-dependent dehydrogenase (short-subunit alcohol dehydrogenase family)